MEAPNTLPKSLVQKIGHYLKDHFVSTTAQLAPTTPIFAAFETQLAGMSDDVSLNARLMVTGLAYAGLGYAVTKGRDLWRRCFNITDTTRERIQTAHDIAYLMVFNIVASPLIYYGAGSRDVKEIAVGTGAAIAMAVVTGPTLGYSIDAFRDLTGIQESARVPEVIRRQRPGIKLAIAAGLTALCIGATSLVYSASPSEFGEEPAQIESHLENIVSE